MPGSISFDASFWDQPRPTGRRNHSSPAQLPVPVVYEDETMLVVAKPAGLAVQPDKSGSENLLDQLQGSRLGDTLYLVHRLDRPVAGLVVLAKTAAAQTALTRQMARGEFRKTYRALVSPAPQQPSGQLVNDLVKLPGQNISRVAVAQDSVKDKKTAPPVFLDCRPNHLERARSSLADRRTDDRTTSSDPCPAIPSRVSHHQ